MFLTTHEYTVQILMDLCKRLDYVLEGDEIFGGKLHLFGNEDCINLAVSRRIF